MTKNIYGRVHLYWNHDMDALLKERVEGGASYREAATAINDKFGTSFTRNAALGRAHRKGFMQPMTPTTQRNSRPRPKPKPARGPKAKSARLFGAALQNHENALARKETEFAAKIVAQPVAIVASAVSFFDARPCHCRWPYGDPRDLETFRFCGEPAPDDRPYCANHTLQSRGQTP